EHDRKDDRAAHRRDEPEKNEGEGDRAQDLVAEPLPRLRAIHAGGDELLADLVLAEAVAAPRDPVAETSRDRVDGAPRAGLRIGAAPRFGDVPAPRALVD